MVPEPTRAATVDDHRSERGFGTGINALIGAVAGVVLSFVPGSPVLGGGVAGYLEGGDTTDRARVGAIAGAIMFVPQALFGFLVFAVLLGAGGPREFGLLLVLLVVLFLAATAVYTVGLSALGGVLSNYLEDEFDL